MKTLKGLTQSQLKSQLHYNPRTGVFKRLVDRPANGIVAGDIAGHLKSDGYVVISVFGKKYRAHRLAFLYMLGRWPKHLVDHRDRNKSNNRWNNIRDATSAENGKNQLAHSSNTSGYKGVSKRTGRENWIARAAHNKERIHLGSFPTPELANEAYINFTKKLHGDFYAK